jgi:uncharacterized membrane protein
MTPSPARLWSIRLLALAGLGLSTYLLIASLSARGPVGCGAGSGCAAVLSSRWASVLGIPVGALAAIAHAALLILSFPAASGPPARRRAAQLLASAVAVSILGAAAWFVILQFAVVRAICPYCMADHAIGALAAALVLAGGLGLPFRSLARPAAAGLLGVAALIALQAALPGPSTLQRLPATGNFDSGPGPTRTLGLLDSALRLELAREPILGAPAATHIIAAMYDYSCPHCRRTHGYLSQAVARWPNDLAVVAIPVPLNASCNPHIPETEPRFADSCTLARLALAVWSADPARFAAFDAWLYEPETPRIAAAARAEAERLIGAAALDAALPGTADRIARNTAAFGRSGTDRLPILLSPEIGGIAGRPETFDELAGILERELKLPASR